MRNRQGPGWSLRLVQIQIVRLWRQCQSVNVQTETPSIDYHWAPPPPPSLPTVPAVPRSRKTPVFGRHLRVFSWGRPDPGRGRLNRPSQPLNAPVPAGPQRTMRPYQRRNSVFLENSQPFQEPGGRRCLPVPPVCRLRLQLPTRDGTRQRGRRGEGDGHLCLSVT